MKKMILFMYLGLLLSCSGDDDNKGDTNLTGTWSMTSYSNPDKGGPITIDNQIFWSFNTAKKELVVINNKDNNGFVLESGTYNTKISGNKLIAIRPTYNSDLKFTLSTNELTVDAYELQGAPKVKFKRMPTK